MPTPRTSPDRVGGSGPSGAPLPAAPSARSVAPARAPLPEEVTDARRPTALVVLSHSAHLARGVADLASALAPHVRIEAVGGDPDGGLGTDLGRTLETVTDLRAEGHEVLLTADLGSAVLTAETVVDLLTDTGVACEDLPVVRGSLAAAVEAESGADLAACAAAARLCLHSWQTPQGPDLPDGPRRESSAPAPPAPGGPAPLAPDPRAFAGGRDGPRPGEGSGSGPTAPSATTGPATRRLCRYVVVTDPHGIHARPAAVVAAAAADAGARLTVDGAPATTLLELLALRVRAGDEVEVEADADDPAPLLDLVARALCYRPD